MSEISITRPDHLDYLEYHPSSHSLRDSEVLIIQDIGAESTFFSTGFNGYVTLYLSSHKRIILFSWNWNCHSSNESLVRALFMSLWKIIALLMIEDISILNNNYCCVVVVVGFLLLLMWRRWPQFFPNPRFIQSLFPT